MSAAAHGCASLMRRAVLHRVPHLMRAVELVKHSTGVHVISMSLALDMAQLQKHAHPQTHVDNTENTNNTLGIHRSDRHGIMSHETFIRTIILKQYVESLHNVFGTEG